MIPFAGNPLNRASEKRLEAKWIESRLHDPSSLIFPMWRLEPFLLGPENSTPPIQLGLLKPGVTDVLAADKAPCIFLGLDGDRAVFALDISAADNPAEEGPLAGLGFFRDARAAGQMVSIKEAAIIAQAKALIDWHQRHRFCARCGAETTMADAGYKRACPKCNAEHFPRTDPVVIMLATHGDACLVGRGKNFPGRFYSALAGFIEPGETIEEAVRRELHEEAGVKTGRVDYFATQPWPFPYSLMIGCFAEAENREITLDGVELADAQWIERDKARAILGGDQSHGIFFPPSIAIAHHLLKRWIEG